jgi:hypothetical protein
MAVSVNGPATGLQSGGAVPGDGNTEATEFVARIVAAGSTIGARDARLFDEFVSDGKAAGWWALLDEVYPFMGDTLAGAMVKGKFASQPTLTQTGTWSAANYVPSKGVNAGVGNSTRKLDSGFAPGSNSRSYQNISLGLALTSKRQTVFGWPMTLTSGTGTDSIYVDIGAAGLAGHQRHKHGAVRKHPRPERRSRCHDFSQQRSQNSSHQQPDCFQPDWDHSVFYPMHRGYRLLRRFRRWVCVCWADIDGYADILATRGH